MKRIWLIQFRKSKKFTQEQVALSAFIDRGYYSQIETGKRNPGLNIAINIAKVLDFDPMMFYKEHLDQASMDKLIDYKITESFGSMESGEILYLYQSSEFHLQHIVTFCLTGFEKRNYCLIIDYHNNWSQVEKILDTVSNTSEIKDYIHFFSKEEMKDSVPLNMVKKLPFLHTVNSLRIWVSEGPTDRNDWPSMLENLLNKTDLKGNIQNILFIRSYNASLITAGMHIEMMRNYPYLMTDFEIVDSPFYQSGNKSYVFPSLFIQENM